MREFQTMLCLMLLLGFSDLAAAMPKDEGTFELQDGDRVVFLGDSLTATYGYTDYVEWYTYMGYPHRNIRFFNAGIGGDTAQGALKRLDETVLVHNPTVVTVCFGINDIGWGMRADKEHIEAHYEGMREIIRRCREAGARVYILGPCPTRLDKRYTAFEAEEKNILHTMSERNQEIAREMGATPIALYARFRAIQYEIRQANLDDPENEPQTHSGDGIHLAELGNFAFAYILLKGLGAPDIISSVEIDAESGSLIDSFRCDVRDLRFAEGGVSFIRHDFGWPILQGPFDFDSRRFIPTQRHLSQYRLKVTGLESSEWYNIRVNGIALTTVTLQQIGEGMDLAYATPELFSTTPPWRPQSEIVKTLVNTRSNIVKTRWPSSRIIPDDSEFEAGYAERMNAALDSIAELRDFAIIPRPVTFEVVPTTPPQPKP